MIANTAALLLSLSGVHSKESGGWIPLGVAIAFVAAMVGVQFVFAINLLLR